MHQVVNFVECVHVFAVEKPPRFRQQNENAQKWSPRDNPDLQRTEIDMR